MSNQQTSTYPYVSVEEVPPLRRFLWRCAGADAHLLVRSPRSDWVKFEGLGGFVLATSVLAFLSGSFALYVVFRGGNMAPELDVSAMFWGLAFGLVWALVIFNLERFIVSSTGHGDGTERITWNEFTRALPRLALACLTGICLSAPLEVKILESETTAAIRQDQLEAKKKVMRMHTEEEGLSRAQSEAETRKASLRTEREAAERNFESRLATLEEERKNAEKDQDIYRAAAAVEAAGGPIQTYILSDGATLRTSGILKRGPRSAFLEQTARTLEEKAKRKTKEIRALEQERAAARAAFDKKAKNVDGKLDKVLATVDARKAEAEAEARRLKPDGLLARLQKAEELAPWMVWLLRLLLISIEISPILFKMMVSRGAYDLLAQNQILLARAEAGIEESGRVRTRSDGSNEVVDLQLEPERLLLEQRRRFETEQMLAEELHGEYRRRMGAEVREHPERFVERQGDRSMRFGPDADVPEGEG